MKKLLLSMTLVVALGVSFTSCRETNKADDASDDIEIHVDGDDVADDIADEADGALEKAGRAVDNAAQEVKEAGKATKDAVDEIGDDN